MKFIPAKYFTRGRFGRRVKQIVVHHWDDPKKRPTFSGTVNWLASGAGRNSIHYVVEADNAAQLVHEKDTAWHAGNWAANLSSVGIEINPRQLDGDYTAAAALIRDIRARVGDVPLVRHRDVSTKATACPGTYDIPRLDNLARKLAVPPPTRQIPDAPRSGWLQRGSRGPQVTALQRGMRKVFPSYARTHGRMYVDGDYGARTETWVREFQRRVGLYADGKVGPLTRDALRRFGIIITL